MTDVTDVLRDRMHDPGGLELMAVLSIGLHAVLIAAVLISPTGWFRGRVETPPRVMTITLGGSAGPSNGGMTAEGGRPVQVEGPEPKRFDTVRPPAAKPPEMVLPKRPVAATKPSPKAPTVTQAPDEARGRTPTQGSQTAPGNAVAVTGARGQGFGLSTGGGAGGAGATLDVADFCCPDYLVLMRDRLNAAWNQRQGVSGRVLVRFTIERDGRLTNSSVEQSSGNPALDLAALSAVVTTKQIPPLPAAFPNPSLGVHVTFEYSR
jgi:TonB family protein